NLSIWRTDYDDQQVSVSLVLNVPPVSVIRNAGKVRYQGGELEISARPIENLTAFLNVGYVEAYYRDYPGATTPDAPLAPFNAKGLTVPVPKWSGNAGFRYGWDLGPGQLSVQATYAYTSKVPLTPLTFTANL